MLSLPLLQPPSSIVSPAFRPLPDSSPPVNGQQQPHQRQQQHRRDEERKAHNARSPLALLAADEAAIAQRKAAIRNFGAYWIRPPGVSKTLQAMTEELAEQAEQEEMARQEQGLRDMQAHQQLEEARQRATEAAAEGEAGIDQEERDLDEDIPEAEVSAVEAEDVTFNEDSMMEGSQFVAGQDSIDQEQYAHMEEAELTGAARQEEELGIEHERDLDESIPEAGSYQHTDTELEDMSSDSDLQDSFQAQSARRSARPPAQQSQQNQTPVHTMSGALQGGLQDRIRAQTGGDALTRSSGSLNLSSSVLESSFVGSSPVMQRANSTTRGRGMARRRGRQS